MRSQEQVQEEVQQVPFWASPGKCRGSLGKGRGGLGKCWGSLGKCWGSPGEARGGPGRPSKGGQKSRNLQFLRRQYALNSNISQTSLLKVKVASLCRLLPQKISLNSDNWKPRYWRRKKRCKNRARTRTMMTKMMMTSGVEDTYHFGQLLYRSCTCLKWNEFFHHPFLKFSRINPGLVSLITLG